jgi:hypothetical protein
LIEFYDDHRVELYNLDEDRSEQHNIADRSPDLVKSLQNELHQWLRAVDAQMPTPNPNYDPSKPEHSMPEQKRSADCRAIQESSQLGPILAGTNRSPSCGKKA